MALRRARLCELLADAQQAQDTGPFFTVGLFSILDALMDAPMTEITDKLAITEDMRVALIDHEGAMGHTLALVIALERGDTSTVGGSGMEGSELAVMHWEATRWADGLFEESGLTA